MVICAGIDFMVSGSDVKLSFGMTTTSPSTIGTTIPPQPLHNNTPTTPTTPTKLSETSWRIPIYPGEEKELQGFSSWMNQDSWSWSTGMKISGLSWGGNSRHPTEDMYLPLGEYNKIVKLCLKTYSEKINHHMEVLLRKLHL